MKNQHLHILGICGTFMAGLAQLAKARGYSVSGCDENVYPPMSDQLTAADIDLLPGYRPEYLDKCNDGAGADLVIVGNAMSRGNPVVEAILNRGLPYTSGPQWLAENILHDRWVLAVAGTHGKTTVSSMLAWILEANGLQPGYLIGGVPQNFDASARLGSSDFFVIEADEYDTAFFDKRSKFIHYHPRTLVLNNLEYDHADIFPDLSAIQQQFHHLVRTVPGEGRIIANNYDNSLAEVLEQGCWTEVEPFTIGNDTQIGWQISSHKDQAQGFSVLFNNGPVADGYLELPGEHNLMNALAAIAAARHVGVPPQEATNALKDFRGVKRRLEVIGSINGITIYDDFAHHPTAIAATLSALRRRAGTGKVMALLEPRSNTMRLGVHHSALRKALELADHAWVYQSVKSQIAPGLSEALAGVATVADNLDQIINQAIQLARPGDHIVLMSNGGFDNAQSKLVSSLQQGGRQ